MNRTILDISSEIGSGITPLRSKAEYWNSNDIPWVKTEQLGEYQIFDANEYISKTALKETTIKLWPPKTVSVAMYGEGKTRGKYKRMLNMKISGEAIERLEEEGFRGPVRKRKKWQLDESYDSRDYQQSLTYYAYAKDLCEHYNFDRNKYRLCVKEKRFVAITKSDFAKLKEDLQFLDNVLKTVLVTYQGYFRERFVDGLSIRKYAEAHQLNRGSVDYQQKKFFSALASLLKERDEAEGICRLLKPAQK